MIAEVTPIPVEFDRYYDFSDLRSAREDVLLPDYPAPENRWHVSVEQWNEMAATGIITVPDGPWNVKNHPRRVKLQKQAEEEGFVPDPANVTPDNPIDPARTEEWKKDFLVTDSGLPVHPLAWLGVTTEFADGTRLGMATGIGRERYYGAIITASFALARMGEDGLLEYACVTTERDGELKKSFPGGYADLGESAAEAAIREGRQEASLIEACEAAGLPWSVMQQLPNVLWKMTPSIGGPCTLNAFLSEHFLMMDATRVEEMSGVRLLTQDPGEIKGLGWRKARELEADSSFMGAHKQAMRAHIQSMRRRRRTSQIS